MASEKSSKANPLKRPLASDPSDGPTPKRPALDALRSSKSRASAPFRSPLLSTTNFNSMPSSSKVPPKKDHAFAVPALPAHAKKPLPIPSHLAKRTTASPFRSPMLKNPPSSSSTPTKPAPTTSSSLRAKLETLRRASRLVKEDDNLRSLIRKWRAAGREAASDLYALVEDPGGGDAVGSTAGNFPETSGDRGVRNRDMQSGFDENWGFGPARSGRFDTSWGWLDPDSKPAEGWGWATVAEHLTHGEGEEGAEAAEGEDREEELPSSSKFRKELTDALSKPYSKRHTMLPPTERGSYYAMAAATASVEEPGGHGLEETLEDPEIDDASKEVPARGMGRMLKELGIPKELFKWDDESEDWLDDDDKRT